MKPDKIILRSEDSEEYTQQASAVASFINGVLETVGVITDEKYYYGATSTLTHDLSRFLEYPSSMLLRKCVIPAGIPSFNIHNNKLRCIKKHNTDNTQNSLIEIVMPTNKVYTDYASFNVDFSAALQQAAGNTFESFIDATTGILQIRSNDPNFKVWVRERNLKFGFLYPVFTFGLGVSVFSATCVQLIQTRVIYVETSIETENYVSDNSTKISTIIPYTQNIETLRAGSFSWTAGSDFFYKIQPANYDKIKVRFLGDYMEELNFNYLPCALEFDLTYKE